MSARIRRDFTMIEMVMVLLIVAVVMTLAAASLTGPDSGADALETHLEKLTDLLQSCRTAALRTGREQQLLYRAATREWAWPEKERLLAVPNEVMVMSRSGESESEAGEGEIRFVFYPDGGARPATVRLRSREAEKVLHCGALTGAVEIADPEAPAPEPLWEEKKW